jgi:hypothetical protein
MSAKVYVLLGINNGRANRVARALKSTPGVVAVDLLEGPPDVVLTMQAPNRKKLAELTVQALSRVESITEDTTLLPVIGAESYEIKKLQN